MSYNLIATSRDDARPIELYRISFTGSFWYYTSADRPITYEGVTYQPIVCRHDRVEPTVDALSNGLPVYFERSVGFADIFRISPPSEIVSLTLMATNYLVDNEFIVFWRGRIIDVKWEDGWVVCTTESIFSSLQQQGLRRRYSRTCTFALYGNDCGVPRENFREKSTTTAVLGTLVTVAAAAGKVDNFYAGGYMTWQNNLRGNVEKRMIRQSFGASGELILSGFPVGLEGSQEVDLFPGCDHLITTCADKFDNEENCGATPYIPTKNPFGGSTLY